MLLDLIGAVALTAASAVVIGALAYALPWSTAARLRAAVALSAWFAIVGGLAASGALDATRGGLGVFFIALWALGRLPAPFAPSAGWGDVLVGLTALPIAHRVALTHLAILARLRATAFTPLTARA